MKATKTKIDAIMLIKPINRKDKTIKILSVRRPEQSDLIGLCLLDVISMEPETIALVAGLISSPSISTDEFRGLDAEDVTLIKSIIGRAFLGRKALPAQGKEFSHV